MPCTCNAICDNDCGSNQLCTGHTPSCSNDFSFTSISIGTIVRASHLTELETAINQERVDVSRRFNSSDPAYCSSHTPGDVACSNNSFSAYSFTGSRGVGDPILTDHWDDVKDANNEVENNSGFGSVITTTFTKQSLDVSSGKTDSIITAAQIDDLQTKINETRNTCICDSHCNCDPTDCGCNGECPSDDYYYY